MCGTPDFVVLVLFGVGFILFWQMNMIWGDRFVKMLLENPTNPKEVWPVWQHFPE